MNNKKIYILMTQYTGFDAKFLRWHSKFPYTHTSIGFEEDMDTFYTFISKGFLVESITRYEKPDRPSFLCALYEMKVSKSDYNKLKEEVLYYKENKGYFKYSTLGLVLCFLKIPHKRKNKYFCSQFVAEVLQKCNVLKLNKKSSLYFPKDFLKHNELSLVFEGTHRTFVEKYVKKSNEKLQ
ncbi:MAG: hypothetical protein IKW45_06775 [Clostridia bacterium]|nr:hypothetical protein [Clostridia bacterium]